MVFGAEVISIIPPPGNPSTHGHKSREILARV